MKKIVKVTGIVALVAVLVCNLEYALFTGDMKNTPNKAVAAWSDYDGIAYCQDYPNSSYLQGDYYAEPNYYQTTVWGSYSESYVYVFQMRSGGSACAPNDPWFSAHDVPPYYVFPYQYVTAITATTYFGFNP